ncbi:MAG: hypothetical protein K8L99_18870 [Anaerolineae bacterium]|nr:hypothetical protein [Anaerolineae bacterium]
MRGIRLDAVLVMIIAVAVTIYVLSATTVFGPLATGETGVTAETAVEWGQPPSGDVPIEGEEMIDATEEAEMTTEPTEDADMVEPTEAATDEAADLTEEAPTEEAE